jgi:hypothetical protein
MRLVAGCKSTDSIGQIVPATSDEGLISSRVDHIAVAAGYHGIGSAF